METELVQRGRTTSGIRGVFIRGMTH